MRGTEKRNTIQRALVLDAVRMLACHPNADEVYERVVLDHPTISKATVYRNLNSLCEDGVLRRVPMPDAADRFDHNANGHYHMQCVKCGDFLDAPCEYNPQIDNEVCEKTGYTNASHDLFISGVCSKCSKSINK